VHVILTRHGSRPQLRAWESHLALHEVTRAPYRIGGRVLWIAPWAGVTNPGNTDDAERSAPPAGLWSALASAVGSEATADLRADSCTV
jgi:hypothetical protein